MSSKPTHRSKRDYRSPLEKHSNHVRAIGMITVENSSLEALLADLLAVILKVRPDMGFALFYSPKASIARLDLITNAIAIAYIPKNPTRKKIEKIIERSRAVMGKRHDVNHSLWAENEVPGEPGVAKMSFPKRSEAPVSVHDLYAIIKTYRSIITDLLDLFNELQPLSPEDLEFLEKASPSKQK
jgi:hypothetical protein